MVKVKSPLFSISASGTIAGFLTFSNRRNVQQCRWQKKQKDRGSSRQNVQRSLFLSAHDIAQYRDFGNCIFGYSLFGLDVAGLKKAALNKKMTWYNYLISEIIKCL
jgi:hypothetical protein